jgi:hypothetical protein
LRRAHRADISARSGADDDEIIRSHVQSPVAEFRDRY